MSFGDLKARVDGTNHNGGLDIIEFAERNLYVAVVSDTMDELGFRNQVMRENLRPVHPGCVFAGWAHTISCSDVYHTAKDCYELEIEAVDNIPPASVVVVSTQQSRRNAPWGELLSTAAKARQARGAVIDGFVRDVKKIEELGFPVFATGIRGVDSRGRGVVTGYNLPVECGEVLVQPGDLVFADYDGVAVVPRAVVPEVVRLASEKATRENSSRSELMRGELLRSVYDKFGVL